MAEHSELRRSGSPTRCLKSETAYQAPGSIADTDSIQYGQTWRRLPVSPLSLCLASAPEARVSKPVSAGGPAPAALANEFPWPWLNADHQI